MHIRCPHCQNPIELLKDASFSDIACPSCGSGFSIITDEVTRLETNSGDTIGHFTIQSRLGVGGFGTVWKAIDTELDRTVAIKVPRKGQLDVDESEYFIREARAAAQLKHPNIVSVHEVGKDETTGQLFIVSDFVDGISLADWITGQLPTPNETAELCQKIAEALHHAHEQGVIHRDLKPGNIMMELVEKQESRSKRQNNHDSRPSGVEFSPQIMDFGLAKRETGEITMTVEGKILGTPAFMSPEQAAGQGHDADARSDIYSLGVILYELLTGEKPFRGNQRMLLHQVLHDEPKTPRSLNDRIPKDLETICVKCMEKEPEKRYATALEVSDELSRYLNHKAIFARPIGTLARFNRWRKRNPLVALLCAAIVITLLIGTTVSTYFAISTNLALKDVRKQKTITEKERDRADQNAENATKNAKQASNAIDKYVDTVQNAELLKEGRFKPLLKELLKDALEHYERFIDQNEHDDKSLEKLANALFRVASISAKSGEIAKGILAYQKSIEIKQKLVVLNPTVTEYQISLGKAHINVGILYRLTGNPEEALKSYQKALEIEEMLVEAYENVAEYQNDVANIYHNIGSVYQNTGKVTDAHLFYNQAIELRTKLITANPSITEYKKYLANTHSNIALLYSSTGKQTEALDSYIKALEIEKKLIEENPYVTEYKNNFAQSYNNFGEVQKSAGKPDEALLSYRKALEIQTKLVAENPSEVEYRKNLSSIHGNLGSLFRIIGQPEKALVSYEKSIEISQFLVAENPTVVEFKRFLGVGYFKIGVLYHTTGKPEDALLSYKKAIEIKKKLVEQNPKLIEVSIVLGASYVNAAQILRSRREFEIAGTYFDLGVKTLSKVVQNNPCQATAKLYLRNAHWGKAELMQNLERFDEAVAAWEKAIRLDSGKDRGKLERFRDTAAAKANFQKKKKPKSKTDIKNKNQDQPPIARRDTISLSKSKE